MTDSEFLLSMKLLGQQGIRVYAVNESLYGLPTGLWGFTGCVSASYSTQEEAIKAAIILVGSTVCRYCGLSGPGFEDAEKPVDYCAHIQD